RLTDASVIAQHALDLARAHKERSHEAYALRLLAEIGAPGPGGPRGEAEALYAQALGLAEDLSMRPLAARCHLGLGRLHARLGRPALAAASLVTAEDAFSALGMSYWVAEARRGRDGAARAEPPPPRAGRGPGRGRRGQRDRLRAFLARAASRFRARVAAALHLLSTVRTPFLNWASRARVSGLFGVAANTM